MFMFFIYSYNPPGYLIGRHVFLSGILSVLSGGTEISLTLVTLNIIYYFPVLNYTDLFDVWVCP